MRLPLIALLGCLLLCAACGADPTPTPVAPLTFTGTGTTDSARFTLPAGDYLVTWQTTPQGDTPCVLGGTLFQEGTTTPRDFGLAGPPPVRYTGLDAGRYYVHVAASCPWHVVIAPAH